MEAFVTVQSLNADAVILFLLNAKMHGCVKE